MIKRIIKTIIHICDDKGWNKTEEIEGDWNCGKSHFIPKRASLVFKSLLPSKEPYIGDILPKHYEFDLVKEYFEMFDEEEKTVVKHLYFEMIK